MTKCSGRLKHPKALQVICLDNPFGDDPLVCNKYVRYENGSDNRADFYPSEALLNAYRQTKAAYEAGQREDLAWYFFGGACAFILIGGLLWLIYAVDWSECWNTFREDVRRRNWRFEAKKGNAEWRIVTDNVTDIGHGNVAAGEMVGASAVGAGGIGVTAPAMADLPGQPLPAAASESTESCVILMPDGQRLLATKGPTSEDGQVPLRRVASDLGVPTFGGPHMGPFARPVADPGSRSLVRPVPSSGERPGYLSPSSTVRYLSEPELADAIGRQVSSDVLRQLASNDVGNQVAISDAEVTTTYVTSDETDEESSSDSAFSDQSGQPSTDRDSPKKKKKQARNGGKATGTKRRKKASARKGQH